MSMVAMFILALILTGVGILIVRDKTMPIIMRGSIVLIVLFVWFMTYVHITLEG